MVGVPADIGDWGLVRVFLEGGRLLKSHFSDFLPIILLFICPPSLVKVLHTQFLVADFVGPHGSTDPEPRSVWTQLLLNLSLDGVPYWVIMLGFVVMGQVLKDKIYVSDCKTERHSDSFFSTVKLALTPKTAEREKSASLNEASRKTGTDIFKEFAAIFVCGLFYVVISMSGIFFTPEAVAAMGLPPWTIFLFTLLVVLVTALSTSYFLLVVLVLNVWMSSPATPILA